MSPVLWIGDSLSQGMATQLRELAQSSGRPLTLHAKQGWTLRRWLPLLPELFTRTPMGAVCVVALGTNDAAAGGGTMSLDLGELERLAKARRLRLVLVTPPTLPAALLPGAARVRAALQTVAAHHPPLVDWTHVAWERASDGIHGTPQGYRTAARALWGVVREL